MFTVDAIRPRPSTKVANRAIATGINTSDGVNCAPSGTISRNRAAIESVSIVAFSNSRESGKTILFVTHSIQEAVFLGARCAVLTAVPARMADYFSIDLPAERGLEIKTTEGFGTYVKRIYGLLGMG